MTNKNKRAYLELGKKIIRRTLHLLLWQKILLVCKKNYKINKK